MQWYKPGDGEKALKVLAEAESRISELAGIGAEGTAPSWEAESVGGGGGAVVRGYTIDPAAGETVILLHPPPPYSNRDEDL